MRNSAMSSVLSHPGPVGPLSPPSIRERLDRQTPNLISYGYGPRHLDEMENVMSELGSFLVVLRGGKHDGNSTTVADGVRRLLTPSDAPGLLDVYEPIEELTHLRGNDEPAEIWEMVGQESIDRVTTEHGHPLPGHDIRAEAFTADQL